MKKKTFSVLFALAMVLSIAAGVFAQDFNVTWDENTVLNVFNDLNMYFPDMFAEEDSDFLWTDNGLADFEQNFPQQNGEVIAKAPINTKAGSATLDVSYDPCGDGLIKFDIAIERMSPADAAGNYYYGDEKATHIRDIYATLSAKDSTGTSTVKLGIKTCESTGGDGCRAVTFKKTKTDSGTKYIGHLKGYMTVPGAWVLDGSAEYTVDVRIDFSTYMTALWPVANIDSALDDSGFVTASAKVKPTEDKNYCQTSLQLYDAFGYNEFPVEGVAFGTRGKYDQNTGEARLQAVVRNVQPDIRRQNYVIPGEVFAYNSLKTGVSPWNYENGQRITGYTCKYTLYNVMNGAPLTNDCKFGEGIAIPNHGLIKIDITIDHLSGDILRTAKGKNVSFALRLGGMTTNASGVFEPVDFPCPPVSRMQVLDPLKPFMTFYGMLDDGPISPSGAYGVYEGGVWGMYQKCGKLAYMAVRIKNDGTQEEVIDLKRVAVAINGGTMMSWDWVMTSVEPERKDLIVLSAGEELILIGRGKVTDYPYQLNADTAMTGAVNFTDFGLYITGKVFSDHNNTRCY